MHLRRVIFINSLYDHSCREAGLGIADYATGRPGWVFEHRPIGLSTHYPPTAANLRMADGILATEHTIKNDLLRGVAGKAATVLFLADEDYADVDTVSVDDGAIGAMAAEHLWSRGYRSLAFIGSASHLWSQRRAVGFDDWLASVGVRPAVHLLEEDALPLFWDWNAGSHAQGLQEILASLSRPCGIFAATDAIARCVLQTARFLRLRVPDDFGVLGADNDPFTNAATGIAISSIELPFREIGRCAAKMLDERWCGASAGRRERLLPLGVVGCAPPPMPS